MLPSTKSAVAPIVSAGAAVCTLLLAGGGCTTRQAPIDTSTEALRARAALAVRDDVRASAAALSAQDSLRLLGADVARVGVQAIWIEVRNDSRRPLWLLRSGIDPDYFSPLEVAWSLHATFAARTNARIDDHFKAQDFVSPIHPGATRSGVVFVNSQRQTRVLNLDLVGEKELVSFSLLLPAPDAVDDERFTELLQRYVDTQATDHRDVDSLRAAVGQLPCCAIAAGGVASGDPLNVVMVGEITDIAAAVNRRGFRRDTREPDDAQLVFARPPDIVLRKRAAGGALTTTWLRIWLTSLRFQGAPLFVAQVGRPHGGRFAASVAANTTRRADVDEARDFLIEDMLYSGGLAKLGFVQGAGAGPTAASAEEARSSYRTDGLRAVLFVAADPLAMDDVELLNWAPHPGSQR
jgi:LssY C-terminus